MEEGARGEVILRGGLRVPAEVTRVEPGHSWSWKVGGMVVDHIVETAGSGSRLAMPVHAESAPWTPAAIAYAPVVNLIARRIVRVAERGEAPRSAG